jgi:hypothetical protein
MMGDATHSVGAYFGLRPFAGWQWSSGYPKKTRTNMLTDLNNALTSRRTSSEHKDPNMAPSSLNNLPSSSSSRLASRRLAISQASAGTPVRWGSAVVARPNKSTNHCWSEISTRSRGGRRTTVWVGQVEPTSRADVVVVGQDQPVAGSSFTQNRIRHAFELFGACMMIVTFLALAMFA